MSIVMRGLLNPCNMQLTLKKIFSDEHEFKTFTMCFLIAAFTQNCQYNTYLIIELGEGGYTI